MRGCKCFEFGARAESSRYSDGFDAGVAGGHHVGARIAYVECFVGGAAGGGQNVVHNGRVGFGGHVVALSEYGIESDVGDEVRPALFGACLICAGGYAQLQPAGLPARL